MPKAQTLHLRCLALAKIDGHDPGRMPDLEDVADLRHPVEGHTVNHVVDHVLLGEIVSITGVFSD